MSADEFLTITQLAAKLGLRERVIQRLVDTGAIPHKVVAKALRFRWRDVDAWWDTLPEKHPASFPAGHPVTKQISAVPPDSSDVPMTLIRGAKGRNRARLSRG